MNAIYNIIIFPVEQILELCYFVTHWVLRNQGFSICGVSIAVSILTLPLYFTAEKHQKNERDFQKKLKPKIDKIRAVFHGDEQYLMLSTLYRQNRYHPVYALRGSLGLFIQIPFFIAAYSYLSALESLNGASFFLIKNLGEPDGLFSAFGFTINILPLLMTAINYISSVVYTKGFFAKEKIQIFTLPLIFLVLLYNSPSGLVLYWTMNNIFSLLKNLVQKIPCAKKFIFWVFSFVIIAACVYLIFFHAGKPITRIFLCSIFAGIFAIAVSAKFIIGGGGGG
jgi:YidC/Oxa1 family membrane protein insertase